MCSLASVSLDEFNFMVTKYYGDINMSAIHKALLYQDIKDDKIRVFKNMVNAFKKYISDKQIKKSDMKILAKRFKIKYMKKYNLPYNY